MANPVFLVSMFLAGITALGADVASSQNYPNKPIRLLTSEAGSVVDLAARLIAQGLGASLRQQVIVDNRGITAAPIVGRAPPDGYTVLLYGPALWLLPFLQDNVAYDPVKDFSPITLAASTPNLVVVHPSLPVKSVQDLIALAKARPGEIDYASSLPGSINHLAGELFNTMARVNITRVNYKGGGSALNALIAGEVQMMFATAGSASPHVKSGKLKALAVTSAQPSVLAPGLPSVAGSGVPGYEAVTPLAIFAPAKTPEAIIRRLNQEIVLVLNRPDVKEKFFSSGVEIVGSSPEQLADAVKSDMSKWGRVIKNAGIKAD